MKYPLIMFEKKKKSLPWNIDLYSHVNAWV